MDETGQKNVLIKERNGNCYLHKPQQYVLDRTELWGETLATDCKLGEVAAKT